MVPSFSSSIYNVIEGLNQQRKTFSALVLAGTTGCSMSKEFQIGNGEPVGGNEMSNTHLNGRAEINE
jgi:hypothetical protein